MNDNTYAVKIDLPALRSGARAVLRQDTLPRYEHLLDEISAQREAVLSLLVPIESHLQREVNANLAATAHECRGVTERTVGTGLQSADDLCRMLARTVLELTDHVELLS